MYLVFEFVDKNLLEVVTEYYPNGFDSDLIRRVIFQLMKAIDFCHKFDVIHRDIKPENLLINLNSFNMKLCDFGFSRTLPVSSPDPLTDYVATRWYRSPELLVGVPQYGPEVDMWAVGCILAEVSDGQPILPGGTELDQLGMIVGMFGELSRELMEKFHENLQFKNLKINPNISKNQTSQRYLPRLGKDGVCLLKACLEIDSDMRISSHAALTHSYFDCMRRTRKNFHYSK
jgi:cyclin-dependent kinase-like